MKLNKKVDTLTKKIMDLPSGSTFELESNRSDFLYLLLDQGSAYNTTTLNLEDNYAAVNLHTNVIVEISKETLVKPVTAELQYSY